MNEPAAWPAFVEWMENHPPKFELDTYIKMLLQLQAAGGPADYRDWARELADRELRHLARVEYPHWWRLAERTELLSALLALEDRSF